MRRVKWSKAVGVYEYVDHKRVAKTSKYAKGVPILQVALIDNNRYKPNDRYLSRPKEEARARRRANA